MPVERYPQRHPRGEGRETILLYLATLLILLTGGTTLLQAQEDSFLSSPSPFDRYEHFLNGEYFRAWSEPAGGERAWSSYERLIRSESAMYAGLGHAAVRELDLLINEGVNREIRSKAALRKGLVELQRGDHLRARLSLNNAVDRETDDRTRRMIAGEALFWIGASHLMESGRQAYDRAEEIFRECADEHPTGLRADDALYYMGQIAEAEERYEEALALYRELLDEYPQSDYRIASSVRRIQLQNRLRRFDDAFGELDRLETLWAWYQQEENGVPQQFAGEVDLELVLLRGDISIGRGDLAGAERAWLTLLYTLDGGYRRVGALGLAETYRVAGMIDSALVLYDRLITAESDEIARQAEFFRALALATGEGRSREERQEGITALEQMFGDDLHPMRDNAALALGDIAYRRGEHDRAVAVASTVLVSGDEARLRARAALITGAALLRLDRPAESIPLLIDAQRAVGSLPSREMPEGEAVSNSALRLEGIARLQSGDHDGAIATFDRFRRTSRDSTRFPEVVRMQSDAERLAGRTEESLSRLEELVATWPNSPLVEDALYTIGWNRFRAGDLKRAEGAFARLVKAWPLSEKAAECQIRRADCYYLNRQFDQAATLYTEVSSFGPTPEEREYAGYQGGMAFWMAGDTAAARAAFDSFAVGNRQSSYADDALFMCGLIDFRGGDYEGAITVMRRLLEAPQQSRLQARAYYTIADAYYRLGRFDEALAAYSIVTERYPESSYRPDAETGIVYARAAREKRSDNARFGAVQVSDISGRPTWEMELRRAEIFLDAGRYEEAIVEYGNFIATNPESPNLPVALLGLAEVELARRDTLAAIDTLQRLVALFEEGPIVPMAALRLAELEVNRHDTLAAIETLSTIRERFPESGALAVAMIREAELHLGSGDEEPAVRILRYGASRLDTVTGFRTRSGGTILWELARLELGRGEIEQARSRWRTLGRRGDSLGAEAIMRLAGSLQNEGRIDEARAVWQEGLRLHDTEPRLRSHLELGLGRTLEFSGELEEAARLYRAVIARETDTPAAQEATNRLEEMQR